jgi:cytochrome bd-type quinol oxidase subunit 1
MRMSPKIQLLIRVLVIIPTAVSWVLVLIFGSSLSQPQGRTFENVSWFVASLFLAIILSRVAAGSRS